MADDKPKRIAYLCFHVAGRDVELPVLRQLGFEIFTIKKFGNDHRSAAFGYEDDAGLSIPKPVLDYLNTVNLVDMFEWPDLATHYLNEYFDYIFIIQNQHVLYNAIRSFKGRIIVRLAGLDVPKTYTNYWGLHQRDLLPAIYRARERIWMSLQYRNLPEVEDPIIGERGVFMPLGIPSFFKRVRDTWHGRGASRGQNILSVLPWIDTPYYAHKLQRADAILEKRPLLVLGAQRVTTADPRIVGFLGNDEYVSEFQGARALFYDSLEPRHVHYPPIEAAAIGLPVIFFRNSLLGSLGTEPLAGACDSVGELRAKLDQILGKDEAFIADVRKSQLSILREFEDDFVLRCWREAFDSMAAEPDPRLAVNAPMPVQARLIQLQNGALEIQSHGDGADCVWSTPPFILPSGASRHLLAAVNWAGRRPLAGGIAECVANDSIRAGTLLRSDATPGADGLGSDPLRQFWLINCPAAPPGSSAETAVQLRFRLKGGGTGEGVSLTMLRMAPGLVRTGQPVLLGKRHREDQPVLFNNFSLSNPHGLDVLGPSASILFALEDTPESIPSRLHIWCDRHTHNERFEVRILMNGAELGRHEARAFTGELKFPTAGALRPLNELEFQISWLDPCPDGETRATAHISRLALL